MLAPLSKTHSQILAKVPFKGTDKLTSLDKWSLGIPHQVTATSQSLGIDKLMEKSLIYLRFVSAHKNQLIDFYIYLFFKTEQKIKNSLIF